VEVVTLGVYAEQQGGAPLWQETQSIDVDAAGRYALLLGATETDGIPLDVFASGEARWLGMVWARPGEVEGPRTRLTSVPYALRASDADTLGGKPASAYVLAPTTSGKAGTSNVAGAEDPAAPIISAVLPGATNYLAKYYNTVDVGTSALYDAGGLVGINTGAPLDALHAVVNNSTGTMTGVAVQNLGNTVNSYSGMLFYDQFGALGQFQGFNNVTHEYRINNIASSGSINFMLGSSSRFQVTSSGIGMGTTAPQASLHVATLKNLVNDIGTVIRSNVAAIKFANNPGGGGGDMAYIAQVVKTGEATSLELGNLNDADDDITVRSSAGRTQFINAGDPNASNSFPHATISVGRTGSIGASAGFVPPDSSTAGGFFIEGSNCIVGFCEASGIYGDGEHMVMWSPGDQDLLRFYDEDALDSPPKFVIDGNGDIRVGTGTVGCVLDADGTVIAGTGCASDERLKKDIRPFDGSMLERALKLRPVYYHWRQELTEKRVGPNPGEAYGLIAQEVEKVYPEMVTTAEDGYKAVDYTRLPYVVLGALQEEHAKVEALDAKVSTLEKRLAKLEAMTDSVTRTTSLGPVSWLLFAGLGAVGLVFYRRR